MTVLEDLWRRASASTPVPEASVLLLIAFAALACVILAWPAVRMVVTVCHEAGHAVAAALAGRSVQGIRLHSDTSGAAGSDAAQLARLTHLPRLIWITLWLGTTLGALAWGTALMLPGLLPGTN